MDITHIKDLLPDPRNARKHTPRNIQMIEESLQQVGSARSIVVDEDNVVLAGNGVIEAAGNVGMEGVKVVDATGEEIIAIRRSNLTDDQKMRLALFDNRTSELAMWDEAVIAELAKEIDLSDFFYADELAALLGTATTDGQDDSSPQLGDLEYRVVVDCKDEQEQADLLARLEGEGYRVRALMS